MRARNAVRRQRRMEPVRFIASPSFFGLLPDSDAPSPEKVPTGRNFFLRDTVLEDVHTYCYYDRKNFTPMKCKSSPL